MKFTRVHIYQEFAKQLFERETWKQVLQSQISLMRNLVQEFHHVTEKIAQSMFESNSTLLPLQDINIWEGSDHEQQLWLAYSFTLLEEISDSFTSLGKSTSLQQVGLTVLMLL